MMAMADFVSALATAVPLNSSVLFCQHLTEFNVYWKAYADRKSIQNTEWRFEFLSSLKKDKFDNFNQIKDLDILGLFRFIIFLP